MAEALPTVSTLRVVTPAAGPRETMTSAPAHMRVTPAKALSSAAAIETSSTQLEATTATQALVLESTATLTTTQPLTISGRALQADGTTVPLAVVAIYYPLDRSRPTTSPQAVESDGSFKLAVDPNTTARVKAVAPGFAVSYSVAVSVKEASTTGVDVIMEPAATISGVVTDEDQKPVADADVKLYRFRVPGMRATRENFGPVKSGSDGAFTLPDLPSNEVHIFASRKGYAASLSQQLNLAPGETRTGIKLVLRRSHHVGGRVTDAETSKPIAGARVSIYAIGAEETSNGYASTDSDGRYFADELAGGMFRVEVRAQEYEQDQRDRVSPDRDDIDFTLEKPGSYTLVGHVIDSKTRGPVKDFDVSVNPGDAAKSAIPGDFSAKVSPDGTMVIIESKGYQTLQDRVRIPKGKHRYEQTFVLGGGGSVTGRTVAPVTHDPVAGVHLELRIADQWGDIAPGAPNATATTGADGRFQMDGGKPGLAAVVLMQSDPPVEINRKISIAHDTVSDLGDIEMSSDGPKIVAHVVNSGGASGDFGVPGIKLQLREVHEPATQYGVTDKNGLFEFPSLTTGYYIVTAPDYGVYAEAALVAQETRDVLLHIGNGQLLGHIVCGGQPVTADVQLRRGEESGRHVKSDASGTFKIESLTAGTYRALITAVQTGNVAREESVEVMAEGITEHTFTLPVSKLTGKVLSSSDAPVAGATVSVSYTRGADSSFLFANTLQGTSGSDGSFEITGLPPGTYTASASKQGSGSGILNNVVVPADGEPPPVTIRMVSDGGTLVSVALDMTTGAPVKQAWCYLFSESGRYDHGATRGADGVMTIDGIPPGDYRVEVSSYGYSVASHQVTINSGESQRLDDVLYESGAVRLTVVDSARKPVINAACHLQPQAANTVETARDATTDNSGLCILRGLLPGVYTATIKSPAGTTANADIIITAHEVTVQSVTLP